MKDNPESTMTLILCVCKATVYLISLTYVHPCSHRALSHFTHPHHATAVIRPNTEQDRTHWAGTAVSGTDRLVPLGAYHLHSGDRCFFGAFFVCGMPYMLRMLYDVKATTVQVLLCAARYHKLTAVHNTVSRVVQSKQPW